MVNNAAIKEALYNEWSESFRSLFHLLRARQCPYFYVCANNFTVLFRAAGICGIPEAHALLSPTTRGFRLLLKQEGRKGVLTVRERFSNDIFCFILLQKLCTRCHWERSLKDDRM